MTGTPEFGILFLGIFVGSILGFGLAKAGGGLKAALTVIGSALGGGPILFLPAIGPARWTYPVGLVLGLLIVRLWFARREVGDKAASPMQRSFAWFDIGAIIAVTIAASIWAAIPD